MPDTASDALVDRLTAWGVEVVFGLPGDGINGVMEALRRKDDHIRFVQVRHEEAAAFMACGYAKFTGKIGVCLATTGPGAIHLLNGLYDAKLDQAPVLAITGMTYHDLIGTHYQQDVNTDYLFQDVAVYDQRIMGAAHVPNVVDLAIRTALARRGVSHLTFPIDFQHQPAHKDPRSERNIPGHTAPRFPPPVRIPVPAALESAAAALRGKRKVVILAGAGARGATNELEQVAERLAAPIVKPLLGKDAVPDDSPYTTGGIGLLGTRPSQEALEECDALLMVGTSFPYTEYLPKPGQAVGVQIDDDPVRIGLRYPVEVGLVGDARATLEALLPLLPANPDRSFLSKAQAGMREWWELMRERGSRTDVPMKPQVVSWNLGQLLRDDAIVTADTGTVTTFAARQIQIRRGQRFSVSGTLASMANGLPYAIGAQVAYPDRQCVAFVGDGGFSMLMAEFATCVAEKLPVKVVVIKNQALGMIRWEQLVFLGNPEYGVELSAIDFAKFAEACGGTGYRIEDPRRCREQLEAALQTEGPVLVEAVVDPFEPPLPPKIKPEQAAHLAAALARGEPNRERIGLTLFRDVVDEAKLPASPLGVPARVVEKISGRKSPSPSGGA
jgi:pyruvate dehydrogenase (quinone)/pyruvate oxidase